MTAEIAVLNKEAVALAADSAITSEHEGGQKIFISANKIFALSKYAPVAVMIYGNAQLMRVPWETLVKIYRRKVGKKEFATLKEHAKDFLDFLETDAAALFPVAQQKIYTELVIYTYFDRVKTRVEEAVEAQTQEAPLAPDQLAALVTSVVNRERELWKKAEKAEMLPDNFGAQLVQEYSQTIGEVRSQVFEKLPLTDDNLQVLLEIVGYIFERWGPSISPVSGVVVAGYGHDEIFPGLCAFDIGGVVNNRLKYRTTTDDKITHNSAAWIVPFAQAEMVYTFMRGADPALTRMIDKAVSKIIMDLPATIVDSIGELATDRKEELKKQFASVSNKELGKYRKKFGDYQKEKFVDPVLDTVALLPKDELAALAESLVNLTSLKRRVSPEAETVAGPIDVAVISKGDGLIWIKRKHYFSRDLNPQFFANYLREDAHGGTEGTP